MKVYVKLPVWSDECMFGIRVAEVTSRRGEIVYVKIPGRKRRSKFYAKDLQPA